MNWSVVVFSSDLQKWQIADDILLVQHLCVVQMV